MDHMRNEDVTRSEGRTSRARGRISIAEPAIAIAAHAGNQLNEIVSFLGQRIFHARRNFGEGPAQNNPLFFQGPQALRERFWADALERTLQLIEAFNPGSQIPDNQDCPFATDNPGSAGNRTG